MTSSKGTVKEENYEALNGLERTFTHISKETLRDLFVVVAESIFERWAKENSAEQAIIDELQDSSEDSVIFSAQTFIAFLQALVSLKRDMELDVLAQQFAFNHEYKDLLNMIATIISRTYIELGDGAKFADDEALLMIRDLLLAYDSTIINRNRFRQVTSKHTSGYKFGMGK